MQDSKKESWKEFLNKPVSPDTIIIVILTIIGIIFTAMPFIEDHKPPEITRSDTISYEALKKLYSSNNSAIAEAITEDDYYFVELTNSYDKELRVDAIGYEIIDIQYHDLAELSVGGSLTNEATIVVTNEGEGPAFDVTIEVIDSEGVLSENYQTSENIFYFENIPTYSSVQLIIAKSDERKKEEKEEITLELTIKGTNIDEIDDEEKFITINKPLPYEAIEEPVIEVDDDKTPLAEPDTMEISDFEVPLAGPRDTIDSYFGKKSQSKKTYELPHEVKVQVMESVSPKGLLIIPYRLINEYSCTMTYRIVLDVYIDGRTETIKSNPQEVELSS